MLKETNLITYETSSYMVELVEVCDPTYAKYDMELRESKRVSSLIWECSNKKVYKDYPTGYQSPYLETLKLIDAYAYVFGGKITKMDLEFINYAIKNTEENEGIVFTEVRRMVNEYLWGE